MTLVEEQAEKFSKRYLEGIVPQLNTFNRRVSDAIAEFYNDRDKIFFLRVLQGNIQKKDAEHKAKCQTKNCHNDELAKFGLFAIAQELERIERYYYEEEIFEDAFTEDEKILIHNNINSVVKKLKLNGVDEIAEKNLDDLKNYFSMGKSKWIKYLTGTVAVLLVENIIERSIIEFIISGILDGVTNIGNLIGTLLITF